MLDRKTTTWPYLAVVASILALSVPVQNSSAIGEQPAPAAPPDTVMMGPFTLANLCDKGGRFALEYSDEGGPPAKEILGALINCELYVLDKKVRRQKEEWRFAEEKGYPKVVVEGPLRFTLKDAKGKDFIVQLARVRMVLSATNNGKSPPTREGLIEVELHVERASGESRSTSVYFTTARIGYNISGKTEGFRSR